MGATSNIGGGERSLWREVEENNSILDILSLRCLGAVQVVILSGQMHINKLRLRSEASTGDMNLRSS